MPPDLFLRKALYYLKTLKYTLVFTHTSSHEVALFMYDTVNRGFNSELAEFVRSDQVDLCGKLSFGTEFFSL